jgi:hypothetical protein
VVRQAHHSSKLTTAVNCRPELVEGQRARIRYSCYLHCGSAGSPQQQFHHSSKLPP